jgi:hypothetical protein
MRPRLYGSLAALSAVVVLAIVVGEASEGALTGWDVALALTGVAAMGGAFVLAFVALAYEIRGVRKRRYRA